MANSFTITCIVIEAYLQLPSVITYTRLDKIGYNIRSDAVSSATRYIMLSSSRLTGLLFFFFAIRTSFTPSSSLKQLVLS